MRLAFILFLATLALQGCFKSKKNYFDCEAENEKGYFGKWQIQVRSRDSIGAPYRIDSDGTQVELFNDQDSLTNNNYIVFKNGYPKSYVVGYLLNGNNNTIDYWRADSHCNIDKRFGIMSTGIFGDLLVTFNILSHTTDKIEMSVVTNVNGGKDLNELQFAEEWIWTKVK